MSVRISQHSRSAPGALARRVRQIITGVIDKYALASHAPPDSSDRAARRERSHSAGGRVGGRRRILAPPLKIANRYRRARPRGSVSQFVTNTN
ncbi:hypothetical protein EVAR_31510_1 [Eumeta japonica]|uniref:Uncharacterized protein n=1 Tax=Eumeta variegata TaxID=151549 RepID=A0A4C1YYM4_EUMVA|nr:hypothetical protein EVAR_31510_1 [Eumeta japonica]